VQWAWAKEEIEEMSVVEALTGEIVIVVATAEVVVVDLTVEAEVVETGKAAVARVEEEVN
jgi:hypothetical protein